MNNELTHHGVKGMKWGVRKKPEVSSPKANHKQNIKQAKEDYKQANIARAKAKLSRDIQGPQGSTAREKAKNYLKSEVQNKAEKLKSQVDYENAVEKADRQYIQELRERGQARKAEVRAKRAERAEKLGKRGRVVVAAIAGAAVVAVGAAIIKKKFGVKSSGSQSLSKQSLKDFASQSRVQRGQSAVNNWMALDNARSNGTFSTRYKTPSNISGSIRKIKQASKNRRFK